MPRVKTKPVIKTEVDDKVLERGDFTNKQSASQAVASTNIGNEIRTQVKAWAKSERSHCWEIARAVNKGIKEESIPENFWRTVLETSFEQEFGEGAAKARGSVITKIISIGKNASEIDFKRWDKDKISFEKASQEFTREALASKTRFINDNKDRQGWTAPGMGSEAEVERQNRELAQIAQKANEEKKQKKEEQKSNGQSSISSPSHDPNPAYATQIQQNPKLLPQLIASLILNKIFMPDKFLIETLCQSEEFKELMSAYINEHPMEFDIKS